MKKLYLLIALSIFLLILGNHLVSSSIELKPIKTNQCIELQQTCSNCTYVNVSSITYPNSTILYLNVGMTKTGTKYNYTFCDTKPLGNYVYSVYGDKNGVLTTEEGTFEVTYTGDTLTTQKSILYIGLLALLIFFFILTIWFSSRLPSSEEHNENGELVSINNLKYLGSVLLFVGWMILIAIFYVTSNLAFAYLGETLFAKILFMIYQICFKLTLPLIFIWFIWIFYQIFQDKKLKGMISKGIYPSKYNL